MFDNLFMKPSQLTEISDHFLDSIGYCYTWSELIAVAGVDDICTWSIAKNKNKLTDDVTLLNIFLDTTSVSSDSHMLKWFWLFFRLRVGAG